MSRTYNPLHFDDLDPKRFEDLIRGLAYDFKDWLDIEATGRSGNDNGFDIRAWEKILVADEEDETTSKKWLIQCKREQSIEPKKAENYIIEILQENPDLYGVLFVASCDLSLKARDKIRLLCAEAGVSEVSIWSRSEIEDQLYQPKNDHLLFAYFGYSIVRRKQSVKTKIRAKLASKRKVEKVLGPVNQYSHKPILIINSEYDEYPIIPADYWKLAVEQKPIVDAIFLEHYTRGIVVFTGEYYAHIDKQKKEYDVEKRHNLVHEMHWESAFMGNIPRKNVLKNHYSVYRFHNDIPESERYNFYEAYLIPYENIVDIDDKGDEVSTNPHIYVIPNEQGQTIRPAKVKFFLKRGGYSNSSLTLSEDTKYKKVDYFPKRYPKPKPIEPMKSSRNN